MSTNNHELIEQRIRELKMLYEAALTEGREFSVLKKIKDSLKKLEEEKSSGEESDPES